MWKSSQCHNTFDCIECSVILCIQETLGYVFVPSNSGTVPCSLSNDSVILMVRSVLRRIPVISSSIKPGSVASACIWPQMKCIPFYDYNNICLNDNKVLP